MKLTWSCIRNHVVLVVNGREVRGEEVTTSGGQERGRSLGIRRLRRRHLHREFEMRRALTRVTETARPTPDDPSHVDSIAPSGNASEAQGHLACLEETCVSAPLIPLPPSLMIPPRNCGNRGTNTTSTTSPASRLLPPPIRPSSSRNGSPRACCAPTTALMYEKDNGPACSIAAYRPSCPWTTDISPAPTVASNHTAEVQA